ncbi:MAG TPA: phage protease [Bryobacteraceae bacterium]
MTVEQLRADLRGVVAEFFAEVEKRMDQGESFQLAVMNIAKGRPDLVDRENSLRDHIKAMGYLEQSISARDLQAWCERRSGAFSCAAVTRLAGAAKRLPIAQLGVRYKGKQKIEITRPMLAEVVANFRKRDTGEVPIDYDHSIETAAGSGDAVPAAGWIKAMEDAPDAEGILWGTVEWTPKAAGMIRAGEYKYISPVIDPNVRDNKTGAPQGWTLTSAALTNTPVLQGMPALVLSDAGRVDGIGQEAGQVSSNDWDVVQVEISRRVKLTMAAHSLDYAAALQRLMLDDRDLWRRYQEAKNAFSSPGVRPVNDQLGKVDSEILPLVREKLAASEGRMDYGEALKAVLAESPDLARRRKDAMC